MSEPAGRHTAPARLAIVEDHPLVRAGVLSMLADESRFLIGYSGADLLAVTQLDPAPDLVLLDLDLDGVPADPALVAQLGDAGVPVLVVSAMATPSVVRQMLEAGVAGFVSKSEPPDVLLAAIDAVVEGGTWTSTETAIAILSDRRCPSLSDQEQQVLNLYASGLKLDAVAHRMNVSTHTASTYLKRVRAKYAAIGRPVASKIDLYREASRDGFIDD